MHRDGSDEGENPRSFRPVGFRCSVFVVVLVFTVIFVVVVDTQVCSEGNLPSSCRRCVVFQLTPRSETNPSMKRPNFPPNASTFSEGFEAVQLVICFPHPPSSLPLKHGGSYREPGMCATSSSGRCRRNLTPMHAEVNRAAQFVSWGRDEGDHSGVGQPPLTLPALQIISITLSAPFEQKKITGG